MSPIYAGVTKPEYSIEDGKHMARLFQIIQLGSQRFEKNGKEWYSPQILLGFELPMLTYENQNGDTVSNIKSGTYFLSMNQSRYGAVGLREIIDGMRGSEEYSAEELEKFDITKFLGAECVVELSGVESKGVTYQNITKVEMLTGEDAKKLPKYRAPILVTTEDFKKLEDIDLPDWIKDKIMASKEYSELSREEESSFDKFNADLEKSREIKDSEEELKLELEPEESAEEMLKKVKF